LRTFSITVFAWIFFRANSIGHAFGFIFKILSPSLFTYPVNVLGDRALSITLLIFIFILIEWMGRDQRYAIARLGLKWKSPLRYALYYAIVFSIFWFGGGAQQFIYFQF